MRYTEAVGIRLNELLKTVHVTQTQFAKQCNVSRMTVNGIIKGRANIVTLEILLMICGALHITLREFFNAEIFETDFERENKKKGRLIATK